MRPRPTADGAVDQRPVAADAMGQQSGVLVIGRHDETIPLELLKISRQRQCHTGAIVGVGRIDDGVSIQLRDISDARVLDAVEFLREAVRLGGHRRLRVDYPAIDAVDRAGRAEVGMAAPVLHATKQQRCAVGQ